MTLCLGLGLERWRVPLSVPATVAILDMLLAPDDSGACASLRRTVEQEPALALWCAVRAAALGHGRLTTTQQTARWLETNLSRGLVCTSALSECATDETVAARASQWASHRVEVSGWAAALAEDDGAEAATAYLAGLLHDVHDWMSLCPGEDRLADDSKAPADLAELLISGGATPSNSYAGVSEYVAAARDVVTGKTEPPRGLDPLRQRVAGAAREAGLRWTVPDEGQGRRLLKTVDLLSRLERLQAEFDARLEREKLEAMAEFAAGAGHELNNPLAVISGRAQLLMRDESSAQRRRDLAVIKGQAKRVNEMIADVMLFGRPPQPHPEVLDVSDLIDGVVKQLLERAAAENKTIIHDPSATPVTVEADPVQLKVAIVALCENALDAIGPGGHCAVHADVLPRDGRHENAPPTVEITVRDDGLGIPPELRGNIFDPFFSGRQAGRGLGFGLSKCWRIITNHGGRLDVDSPPEGGALFTVTLPSAAEISHAKSSAGSCESDG